MSITVVEGRAKYQQIIRPGFRVTGIVELSQIPVGIHLPISKFWIEKILGMAVAVGHFVSQVFVIIAFDKFHTLVSQSEVVAVRGDIPSLDVAHIAVVMHRHTVVPVYDLAYLVFLSRMSVFQSISDDQPKRQCHGHQYDEGGERAGVPHRFNLTRSSEKRSWDGLENHLLMIFTGKPSMGWLRGGACRIL